MALWVTVDHQQPFGICDYIVLQDWANSSALLNFNAVCQRQVFGIRDYAFLSRSDHRDFPDISKTYFLFIWKSLYGTW